MANYTAQATEDRAVERSWGLTSDKGPGEYLQGQTYKVAVKAG